MNTVGWGYSLEDLHVMCTLYHPLRHTSAKPTTLLQEMFPKEPVDQKSLLVSHSSPFLQAFTSLWVLNLAARSYPWLLEVVKNP